MMSGVYTANRLRLIKKRYRRMSTANLQSLLSSVDSGTEARLIESELKRRG